MTADVASHIETFQQNTYNLRDDMRSAIKGALALRAGGLMSRDFLEEEVEANFTDLHNEVAMAHTDLVEQIECLTETGTIILVDEKYFTVSSLARIS